MCRSKEARYFKSFNLHTVPTQSCYLGIIWYPYNKSENLGERGKFRKENHLTQNHMPLYVCGCGML